MTEFEQFYAHIDAAPKIKPEDSRLDLRKINFRIHEVPTYLVFNPEGVKRLTVSGRPKKRG